MIQYNTHNSYIEMLFFVQMSNLDIENYKSDVGNTIHTQCSAHQVRNNAVNRETEARTIRASSPINAIPNLLHEGRIKKISETEIIKIVH